MKGQNKMSKEALLREATLQNNALKIIQKWLYIAIAISTMGVAITYYGFRGEQKFVFVFGIMIIVIGVLAATIINFGMKNGRRNVEKILRAIENN